MLLCALLHFSAVLVLLPLYLSLSLSTFSFQISTNTHRINCFISLDCFLWKNTKAFSWAAPARISSRRRYDVVREEERWRRTRSRGEGWEWRSWSFLGCRICPRRRSSPVFFRHFRSRTRSGSRVSMASSPVRTIAGFSKIITTPIFLVRTAVMVRSAGVSLNATLFTAMLVTRYKLMALIYF